MKKLRFLSLFLACLLVIGVVPAEATLNDTDRLISTINGDGKYASNWKYWSQGASKYEKMRKWGCGLIAFSKLMVESGIKSSGDFTPDDFYLWARDNGHVDKTYNLQSYDTIIAKYTGASISLKQEWKKTSEENLMNELKNGKYIVLRVPGHFIYVLRNESISAGKIIISNSKSDVYDSTKGHGYKKGSDFEAMLHQPLSARSDKNKIEYALIYTIGATSSKKEETGGIRVTVAFSNYQVRSLTETSAEPYATVNATGAKVTEVGMYIGLTKEKMTKLGSDNGKAGYKKNMWYNTTKYGYPLKQGTTYYYQPYAVVGGETYWGDIKNFTTDGTPGTQTICDKHTYTSAGGNNCTVCGYQYTLPKNQMDKTMYAAEEEVVVRSAPYAVPSNIVKTIKKDDAVKISYSTVNSLGNDWYITSDGYYIYAERLTSTAPVSKDSTSTTPPTTPPTQTPDAVTFSNYQVRELTSTSAEPYATATAKSGKVARVGMYIGTDKNNLTQLGTDNGTPKNYKNMWYNTTKYNYPLKPNTTYYYQPFAEVDGVRYYGDIKSFTTKAQESMVTFSNYKVRNLTATSAEPYATATAKSGKVARVGMYIGTDKNNLTQLGTDNGTPKNYKNMWYNTTKYNYPLKPNTTYYYQPFAEVDGVRYYGDIKSFTTPSK